MAKETGGLGNPESARSKAGAMGIAQFMPATAKQYGIDPMDMNQALPAAAKMTSNLLKHYGGDQKLAAMAYNWGQGNVDKWLSSGADPSKVPGETRGYTRAAEGGIMKLAGGGIVAFNKGGTSEDEQQKQDKEDFMMGLKKLGASAADVVTLPVRGAMGAVNTGIVRPIRATGLNLPYIPEEAFGGSSSSMTPYYDRYVRANEKPASTPTQSAPSTPATQQDFDAFDAATRDFEKEQMGRSNETDNERQAREDAAKTNARKAMGAGEEDITSLREMLDERSKSLKNQKSIDNYMALLQAGLGMMGGTSPYAAANIGQGASKGITHLADARKAQIADENALLSGRLGLSRAQLYEQSRKDALAAKIASDKGIQAHRTNMYGLGVSKAMQTQAHNTNLANLKARELYDKAGGDVGLRQDFVKQYGKNWETDPRHMQLFKLKRSEAISDYLTDASAMLNSGSRDSSTF